MNGGRHISSLKFSIRSFSTSSLVSIRPAPAWNNSSNQENKLNNYSGPLAIINNLLETASSKFGKKPSLTQKHQYKASTSPSGIPLSKFFSVKFPLPIMESFQDYKKRNQLLNIQDDLLTLLDMENLENLNMSVLKVPIHLDKEGRVIKIKDVMTDGTMRDADNYINEVCISPKNIDPQDKSVKHLILIHGYGAGLGFYIKNLEKMAEFINQEITKGSSKWCIHAIDLLGYGSSSRPKINYKTNNSLQTFEDWFVDSLENWRIQRQLNHYENNLVIAHSMGAYLSVCYNIKYPKTFRKLVLVSPAGMIKPATFDSKRIPGWFNYLWNKNVSPFALVRYSGPLGSFFVSGWTSRRFANLTHREHALLHRYSYGIFNARGSGEYFLNYVLSAGGVPRYPLVKNKTRLKQVSCETEWLYGDNDWMDSRGGLIATKFLTENNKLKAKVKIFEGCGHHIYLDDITGFNNYLLSQMKEF
ncbi:carboxylic ester hydrolase [Saccharomycopsis crataegensis]|uniref:Carboxylic ester hydrolase n=1 Tax=Saccharomycopsis crataegensis TaxID=43959 RepID=A0AAV5QP73_9ASCO|nr:carboxylic ester hydrolase [Saccharomycopsis crataegensis]